MLNLAWLSDVELVLKKFKSGLSCREAPGFIRDSALEIALSAGFPPFCPGTLPGERREPEKLSRKLLFYSQVGVRSNAVTLIKLVKESTFAFGEIIQKGIEAGEYNRKMVGRLSEQVKRYSPEAELPGTFKLNISGYVDCSKTRDS